MPWPHAIECHRLSLITIVMSLYAMIGLDQGGTLERVARPLHRAVLALLRPAESALRRLIVVAAHGLTVKPHVPRPGPTGLAGAGTGKGGGRPGFPLFDPRVRHDSLAGRRKPKKVPLAEPRIWCFDDADPRIPLFLRQPPVPEPVPAPVPAPVAPVADGSVSAGPLCRRLAAMRGALADLGRQARRYARWQARPIEERRPSVVSALRPGPAPYLDRKARHEVHAILEECHWLARSLPVPKRDSS